MKRRGFLLGMQCTGMIVGALLLALPMMGLSACGSGERYSCVGGGTCSEYSRDDCDANAACSWEDRCIRVDCRDIDDPADCSKVTHCRYSETFGCENEPSSGCPELSEDACKARPVDCLWVPACGGTFDCRDGETMVECQRLGPGCAWEQGGPDW